ncbi:hypothetical protein V6N13_036894 [Hibiscus sabdariffa]|uniref:Uncharacterized protein n=2 Tax=Hibiscus sabdariffa TaxID=183260 RepID=A0ABR2NJT4_9ROSI
MTTAAQMTTRQAMVASSLKDQWAHSRAHKDGGGARDGDSIADCLSKIGNNSEPHEQLFLTLPVAVLSLLHQDLDRFE